MFFVASTWLRLSDSCVEAFARYEGRLLICTLKPPTMPVCCSCKDECDEALLLVAGKNRSGEPSSFRC